MTEGQIVRVHVIGQEVLLVVLPWIGLESHIAQKHAMWLLMGKVKEPRVVLVGVRLEIEQVVDLVGRRHAPPFEMVENIECRKHYISVGGYLKWANIEIICHPREVIVRGKVAPARIL